MKAEAILTTIKAASTGEKLTLVGALICLVGLFLPLISVSIGTMKNSEALIGHTLWAAMLFAMAAFAVVAAFLRKDLQRKAWILSAVAVAVLGYNFWTMQSALADVRAMAGGAIANAVRVHLFSWLWLVAGAGLLSATWWWPMIAAARKGSAKETP